MADVVQIDAALLDVEFVKDAVVAHPQLEFGAASKAIVREIVETPAYLVYPCVGRPHVQTPVGNQKALENVGDQIWSAAATIYSACRVVYCPAAISRRDWSSLAFTSSVSSS